MTTHKRARPVVERRRAILYLRVSKEGGQTKHGIDVQRDACEAYVCHHAYEVVGEYIDDGKSGGIHLADRAGLKEAFQRAEAGEADVIVAYNQDRFARKMGVFEEIRERAVERGIRLETTDGRVLTAKEDFINGDVVSLLAALERRRISERFYAARRHRSRDDGRGSGVVPFGYDAPKEKGPPTVDLEEARCIQRVFALRDGGAGYRETAEQLNTEGYRTRTGLLWTPGTILGIERRRVLYETGRRQWDGVTAGQEWPVILGGTA